MKAFIESKKSISPKHGLPVPLVTITDEVEGDVNGKNLIIVLTRSHPSDSATSFVVQGTYLSKESNTTYDTKINFALDVVLDNKYGIVFVEVCGMKDI